MPIKIYTNKSDYKIWYKVSIILWIILGICSIITGFIRNNIYLGFGGILIVIIAIFYSIYVACIEKRRDRKMDDMYDNFNNLSSSIISES